MEGKTRIGASIMVATLQATLNYDEVLWGVRKKPHKELEPKMVKYCRICKEPHKHNNDFCSADCCKAYKELKTQNRS